MVICAGSGGVGQDDHRGGGRARARRAGPEGRRGDDRPGAAARERARPRHARATSRTGSRSRSTGELWAMMLDAKRTFDQLIEHLAPDERTRDEVFENRIYQQLSSAVAGLAGVHGDREALRARPIGRLRRARAGHAAVAQRARLPRRPGRLTRFFQGRAIRIFLKPAGSASAAAPASCSASCSGHRRRPAARPVGLLPLAGRDDRRLHRARPARRRAARGPGDDVPDRDRAAPRPGRGGDLLPPQAARGGDAVRRPGRQPRPSAAGRRAARRRWRRSSARRWPSASARRDARSSSALAARDAANVERLRAALADPPTLVVPELEDDVHDLEGLAAVRAHLFA